MKNLKHLVYRFSFLVLLLFVISCKKDTSLGSKNDDTYMVTFKLNGFTNQVSPLQSIGKGIAKRADIGSGQNYDEGYLYYWSFNNENLVPDIRYNPLFMPTISYANGIVPTSFVISTYAFDNFVAGKALTFSGANDIIIKMPIKNVIQVTSLGFDVGSPGTGPKDFDIFFSINEGDFYEILQSNNQFGNTDVANQKNSFSYDLTGKNMKAEELWIKIKPKAGIRGQSANFNENSGILRMDNLRLIGVAGSNSSTMTIDKLHYFLFNVDKPEVILADVSELNGSNLLEIAVPLGRYKVCFITNTSNAELLLPKNPTLETFYISNIFSNANAEIFGYVGELNIDQDQTHQVEVERLFSQIKIEFTDAFGIEQVTKIVIDQVHDPFFYSPFNISILNPISDQTSIELVADFSNNKQVVFNQFLGNLIDNKPIDYNVLVYTSKGLLRTINMTSTLKNNMQLVFRGNILEGIEQSSVFEIRKNENWNGSLTTDF